MYILCSSFCCCCRFAENKNLNESASALVGSVIYVTWCFFSTRTGLGYTIIWVISLIWNMSTVKQSYETCRIPLDWRYLQSDIFKQHSGGVWVSDSCCSRYSIVELSQYHTQMNAMRNYKLCLSEKYVVLFIARPIQFDMLNNSTYQLAVRWCLNKLFLSVHSEKCTPHTHTHCWFIGNANDFPFDLLNEIADASQHKCNARRSHWIDFQTVEHDASIFWARLIQIHILYANVKSNWAKRRYINLRSASNSNRKSIRTNDIHGQNVKHPSKLTLPEPNR